MRFSVTLLVLRKEACDTTFGAASESDQSHLKQRQFLVTQYDFLHPAVSLRPPKFSSIQLFRTYPKPASVIYEKLQAIASRIRENKYMAAFRIAVQMIAY